MRSSAVFVAVVALLLLATSAQAKKKPEGERCNADSECASGGCTHVDFCDIKCKKNCPCDKLTKEYQIPCDKGVDSDCHHRCYRSCRGDEDRGIEGDNEDYGVCAPVEPEVDHGDDYDPSLACSNDKDCKSGFECNPEWGGGECQPVSYNLKAGEPCVSQGWTGSRCTKGLSCKPVPSKKSEYLGGICQKTRANSRPELVSRPKGTKKPAKPEMAKRPQRAGRKPTKAAQRPTGLVKNPNKGKKGGKKTCIKNCQKKCSDKPKKKKCVTKCKKKCG